MPELFHPLLKHTHTHTLQQLIQSKKMRKIFHHLENVQLLIYRRERDATREAALRKALEERMDQLVDMYGDPAVTQELRDRLPRAKKDDPVMSWKKQMNEMSEQDDL